MLDAVRNASRGSGVAAQLCILGRRSDMTRIRVPLSGALAVMGLVLARSLWGAGDCQTGCQVSGVDGKVLE